MNNKPKNINLFFILSLGIHGLLLAGFTSQRFKKVSLSNHQSHISQIKISLKRKEIPEVKKVQKLKKSEVAQKKVKKNIVKKLVQRHEETSLSKVIKRSTGQNNIEAQYLKKVRDEIIKNRRYPRIAKRLRKSGIVNIAFDIEYPGRVSNLKLIKKVDFEPLNESALDSVSSLENFPQMPVELSTKKIKVNIPISFELL